jgi:LCP family protein required for cell wall assembly
MRTTLKRGMGRAATVNGNGRAVFPPAVLERPVPVAEPARRYRQPGPPPRTVGGTILRIFGWILLAVVVVASGIAGGLYLWSHETLSALGAHSKQAIATSKDKNLQAIASPSEAATALVVGYDTRKGADAAAGQQSRSDTIMLIRADPSNNTLSLLSFPRDLQVPIYCRGATAPVTTDRINSAYARPGCGGVQATLDTVAHLTGLPINYVITLDFHGFKLLVNKLHGVYITVDHRYLNTVGGPGGFAKIDLQPGYQKLDGEQALDYVRFRHTDSDLYRLARQQFFLDALKDRLAGSFHITEIPSLVGAIKGSVEVVKPGAGAPSVSEIQSYAGLGYHLPPGHLFRNSIPNLTDCGYLNAEVCSSPSDIAAAVQSFQHPDVTLPSRANAAALGRKVTTPKARSLKTSAISTLVLNGTSILGLARDTSYKLAVAGYHTMQLPASVFANAPTQNNYANTVYYDTVQPNGKQAARQLAAAMGPHTNVAPLPAEIAPLAQQAGNPLTVVVVGTAFSGDLVSAETHIVATPTHTPPAVRTDPGLTLSTLQSLQPKVPFRLMVPHVIGSNSGLAELEPFRSFKPVAHKHEVVMTFYTGPGNIYWNVIETNWTDAPILRKPTGKYPLKDGRTLDLFTNGGSVHMAVLRTPKASYWVVNTLRDELSNETILAIARGLQPLAK